MRKIHLEISVGLIVNAEDGVELSDILDKLDLSEIKVDNPDVDVEDARLIKHFIIDSK